MKDRQTNPRFLLPVGLILLICAASSRAADVAPTTRPVGIIEIRLEDPLSPESKTYLDLDTGRTFARSEQSSLDFLASRQWVRQKGVDLMCESREPASG